MLTALISAAALAAALSIGVSSGASVTTPGGTASVTVSADDIMGSGPPG